MVHLWQCQHLPFFPRYQCVIFMYLRVCLYHCLIFHLKICLYLYLYPTLDAFTNTVSKLLFWITVTLIILLETIDVSCSFLHTFSPFQGVSVTSVAFGPRIAPYLTSYVLALGAESGDINYWDLGPSSSILLLSTESNHSHGSTVKKLAWSPNSMSMPINKANENLKQRCEMQLSRSSQPVWRIASCGEDHTVRIYQIVE